MNIKTAMLNSLYVRPSTQAVNMGEKFSERLTVNGDMV